MKVLVACEESQAVCIAFRNKGHEAYSCDIQPCSGGHPEWHIQGDAIKEAYSGKYDLMIGHPPCTYLSYVCVQHSKIPGREKKRQAAKVFFMKLYNAPISRIAIENPVGYMNTVFRPADQVIQPYFFRDPQRKRTCLWLKNLPRLFHANIDDLFNRRTHCEPESQRTFPNGSPMGEWYYQTACLPKAERAKARSKTFPGIARAMAEQWGNTQPKGAK